MLLERIGPAFIILVALIALIIIQVFVGPYLQSTGTHVVPVNLIFDYTILGGALLMLLVAAATVIWTWLEYTTYSYMIDEHAFKIKRGILTTEEISVMYRQMQNVDIERPFFYRLFGLSRIVILTAGHEDTDAPDPDEAEGILDAVDANLAVQIQSELLRRSNIEEVVAVPAAERG